MALTTPRGPLGPEPAGWFSAPVPDDVATWSRTRVASRRCRGRVVIDTEGR